MQAKVSFHTRRFLTLYEQEHKTLPLEETVLHHLIDTYKEYARKPKSVLKTLIHRVYANAQEEKKRARSDSIDSEERFASEHDQKVQAIQQSSSALNASIRANYAANLQDPKPVETLAKKAKRNRPKKQKVARDGNAVNENGSESVESVYLVERPRTRYSDFGGIHSILQEVKELIEYPLTHPEVYVHLGVEPPRGILLHGPPGTGKTMLANSIAGESGAAFIRISAPEIVSGMSGESEQKVRELFQEAVKNAPAIVFIDEIDAITPKRETVQRGMERRIVAQLLTSIDSLSLENTGGKPVLIIGATNRPDALDSALRRAGRFDREICLGIPDETARMSILQKLAGKMRLDGAFDFQEIARKTPGYVGADLVSLTKEAAVIAVNRIFSTMISVSEPFNDSKDDANASTSAKDETPAGESVHDEFRSLVTPFTPAQLEPLRINMADFLAAIQKVQPSSKREGFATISDVSWADVGALAAVRDELVVSILHPIRHPERFQALGLEMPAGVLLYGPPGCGKTLLAKAIANESEANFISIKGPELLDKYVGESERAVRQVFQRARASSPCVIFFDELDALCPRRSNGMGYDSGNSVTERVVNQLLTEMDGLDSRKNVFVIAATNRPDIIDPAMLRPGRLDKLLYVPLPVPEDRLSILQTVTRRCRLDPSICLSSIALDQRCDGFSGADISALVREAGLAALRDADLHALDPCHLCIAQAHFQQAFVHVFPSVSRSNQRMYEKMRKNLRRTRASLAPTQEVVDAEAILPDNPAKSL
uniref:Ribosome biogenesis ATPase RIX7 putative n=1 Tax=Albugo laibachii Nc14 TaxID=890382 RepID=F0WFI7_9STRA|nr:ribosome biogenesis ATPase RIX7 putative [Albugo laibachii Nc14]|eukprot:CCA19969.1 ribosome biogenesis ATPase RIX7 putative [Albugo laibachii Nc14]